MGLGAIEGKMNGKRAYTIYQNPLDPDDQFIVREWLLIEGDGQRDFVDSGEVGRAKSLAEARKLLPVNSTPVPKPEDLQILETWI